MTTKLRDPSRPAASRADPPAYRPDGAYDFNLELPACPDTMPRSFQLDAKLWEGRFQNGRLRESRVRHYDSRAKVQRQHRRIRESADRRLREATFDWFAYGGLGGAAGSAYQQSPLLSEFIPLVPGPATRQQYWSDYFATSAKCFEAYHHDPLAHQSVQIKTRFVLGKGVEARAKTPRGQQVWDDFATANSLKKKIKEIDRDLTIFGELIIRFFDQGPGTPLIFRSLDPASIYDIITDQEDIETVFFYHQQFQTPTQLFAPPAGASGAPTGPTTGGTTRFVIRQIPADEVLHVKENHVSAEKRGRPDMFSALGYLKRLRDLMTSRVIKADLESRMVFNLKVDNADDGAVARVRNALFPGGRPPDPGTVLAMNQAATLEPFIFNAAAESGIDSDIDGLLNLCAVGLGVPKEYLGITGKGASRAGALVATEPAAKCFEDRQDTLEEVLQQMWLRVSTREGLTGEDAEMQFIFPSIVTEDRSGKLKDIAFAEADGVLSKKTAAGMIAKELGVDDYDFDAEQKAIADEFSEPASKPGPEGEALQGDGKIRRPMLPVGYGQTPKLDPTKRSTMEDLPPGLLSPAPGDAPAAAADDSAPATRAGFPADENPLSAAGSENIRKDNQLRESHITVSDAAELVARAVREASVRRTPRRRPDDPEFQQHAQQYRRGSEANAAELVADHTP